MKIKSSYNATIVLPPNFPIYPGAEVDYPHWAKHKANPAIAWYVDSGHLTLGEDVDSEEDQDSTGESESQAEQDSAEVIEDVQFTEEVNESEEDQPTDSSEEVAEAAEEISEDEQKEALIAQLAELDIKADKRSSVEKLQEKLDEALAK